MAALENAVRAACGRWVSAARRIAWPIVVVATLFTAGAGFYAATHAGINTDTSEMLDRRLPFRQLIELSREKFPLFGKTILIVLDGETSGAARTAADELSQALRRDGTAISTVFYPADDPFFRQNGFLYLETDALQATIDRLTVAQPFLGTLTQDTSLRGFLSILTPAVERAAAPTDSSRDGPQTAVSELVPILDRMTETVQRMSAGVPGNFPWEETLADGGGSSRELILVQPTLDYGSLSPAKAAIADIRRIAESLDLLARGVDMRLTGAAALAQEELKSVEGNIGFVGLVSLALVGFLLFVAMRSPPIAVAVLFALICGLVWTGAFAIAVFGTLNLISVAFAVLFIGLGVDFGIHYGLRVKQAMDEGEPIAAALPAAAKDVGFALALTTIMAAIGFLSFLPTDYRGLSQLGVISAAGMAIAFIATLTLCPAVLAIFPPKPVSPPERRRERDRRRMRDRYPGAMVAASVAMAIALIPVAAQIRFDFDPMNLRDPQSESVTAFRDLMTDPRTNPYQAEVLVADAKTAEQLARRLESLPEVESARTLASFVPKDQDEKLAIIEDAAFLLAPALSPPDRAPAPTVTETAAALATFRATLSEAGWQRGSADPALVTAAQRLDRALAQIAGTPEDLQELDRRIIGALPSFLDRLASALAPTPITVDTLPENIRDRYVAADGTARIEIFPAVDVTAAAEIRRFVAAADRIANGVTGTPAVILAARDAVLASFFEAAWLSVAAISLLLILLLRSLVNTLFVLAPMILAVIFTGATAVMAGLALNFANVIVLPLLLGLGVASGIHLVTRGRDTESSDALRRSSTPRAILFSALTTIASFGSLALSTHPGTASMGLLLTIAISYTLLCTLIVLPALIALRRNWSASP